MSNSSAGNVKVSSRIVVHLVVQFCTFHSAFKIGKIRESEFSEERELGEKLKRAHNVQ